MTCTSLRGAGAAALAATLLAVAGADCGGEQTLFSSGGSTSSSGSGGHTTSGSGTGGEQTSSGAGGTTSGGGGAGGGTSSGQGGSNGEGSPCDWGGAPCAQGLFCNAPGCGAGVCTPIPPLDAQQGLLGPVCGCDGVSYFNDTVAATSAMSVAHGDGCGEGELIVCDSSNAPCAPGLSCNMQVQNGAGCFMSPTHEGSCWAMPEQCGDGGPQVHLCNTIACADVCTAIKKQAVWYEGPGCF